LTFIWNSKTGLGFVKV